MMPLYALPACPLVPCPLLPYGVGLSSPFMFGASRAVSAPEGPTVPGAIPAPIIYLALLFAGIAIGGLLFAVGNAWRIHVDDHRRAQRRQARERIALERHFNPYVSGEPVRQPEMFFGRHELIHRIINGLHQNSVMIHGERRIGKTSLLYQLAAQLREADDPEWVFVPASADLEGTPQERFFHLLMDAIWGSLRGYLIRTSPVLRFHAMAPSEYTDRDFIADLRLLIEPLKASVSPRRARVILLIDEIDVINSYSRQVQLQFRRVLMSNLAENLGAVVAGAAIDKAWDRPESPWYNLFVEFTLEPFSDEQARELLLEPVRGVYEWAREAVDYTVLQSQGRPHRLQGYAFTAVNHMLAAKRLRISLADVKAANGSIGR